MENQDPNQQQKYDSEASTYAETFIVLGDPNNPQNNGKVKGKFVSTHWHFYLDDENCDYSFYESIALINDQTGDWIFETIIFCYETKLFLNSIRNYALENKVNVSFSYPDKDWIIKEFEKFGPWCQFCGVYPCQCGAYYYRHFQYLYGEDWALGTHEADWDSRG
ncbi:MAG: hypothetical protein ACYSTR_02815 [Planctomycetota bacterium]|jgi:hypothetical protein